MKSAGLGPIHQVRVSGGGSRSPLWRQILADVLNTELVTVNSSEGAAYGAALLAGVGAGVWPDVDTACRDSVQLTGSAVPQPDFAVRYENIYAYYGQLYPALRELSHGLSAL
jgi:xylulokinase